jgi:hypothetical protein
MRELLSCRLAGIDQSIGQLLGEDAEDALVEACLALGGRKAPVTWPESSSGQHEARR